jgi:circadian clock protein KaiB
MDTAAEPVTGEEPDAGSGTRLALRLYVAGSAPNSVRAHANLLALLERAGRADYDLEVVDCILEPQRALQDGVLVTPTLVKVGPPPRETVIGTLSDTRGVAMALGILGQRTGSGGRGDLPEME